MGDLLFAAATPERKEVALTTSGNSEESRAFGNNKRPVIDTKARKKNIF